MKTLIHVRTAFLLVLVFVAIQAGAKDIYIKPGTGTTPTVDASTAINPAPFSLLRTYLATTYNVSSGKQLNVHFDAGTYNITDLANQFITFGTDARVNGLEVTFKPQTPSNGGAKGVIFNGTGATTRFVELTGSSGSPMSLLIEDVQIQNFKSTGTGSGSGGTSLFDLSVGASLTLDDVVIDQIESRQLSFAYQANQSSFTVKNSTLSNITTYTTYTNPIISSSNNASLTSFENCTLDAWKTTDAIIIDVSNLSLNGCTIKNFVLAGTSTTGSTNRNIIRTNVSGTRTKITNNSFIDNAAIAPTTTHTSTLINFGNGTPLMYNNTLSGNTVRTAITIAANTTNARVINNTLYNSGNVDIINASARVINNIVAGSSTITVAEANATTCLRNISGSNFYPTGITGGTNISTAFSTQFNTTLPPTAAPGKVVHELSSVEDPNHVILKKGGLLTHLFEVSSDIPASDQRGIVRPETISLGSVDLQSYIVSNPHIIISYDSKTASLPAPRIINILDYVVVYPYGITPDDPAETSVKLSDMVVPNGTLSSLFEGTKVTFTPEITGGEYTGGGTSATFRFTVSPTSDEGSITYSKTGVITITVVDLNNPPGHIQPSDFYTCYDYMGTVTFTSAYRFITSYTDESTQDHKDPVTGLPIDVSPPINDDPNQRMYGFSIPLVGDLDGDGYPEIIGTGKRDGTTDLNPYYNFLYIYNGQTGKLISRLPFDLDQGASEANRNSGYHSSPSIIALVDANRDGKIEVIAAFPGVSSGTGTFPYTNKLVSYVLTPVKDGAVTTGYGMPLNPLWPSTPPTYNTGADSYQKAIPQIVDIDGDGDAEVVVYNKIYSAVTGELKVEMETLGSTAYVGSATANATSQDGYIGFSYVYDLDLDGKYDVVAGGKVYYNINVNDGSYEIQDFSTTVKDGRTGVADIDGDGIPDIVVVNRNTSSSSLEIYVWDPGFLEINGSNVVKKTAPFSPNLKAHRSLPLDHPGEGTNSYVYIGDIDGREQQGRRLPEIAVLAGRLTYSSGLIHPNVAGSDILPAHRIPTTGNSGRTGGTGTNQNTGEEGVLAAVTWDSTLGLTASDRLKLSFVLGHDDTSGNTGFTMFDFDNDGMMEICYRDEQTLRIIKASRPCVPWTLTEATAQDVILFSKPAVSYSGFEYPVIADIDNDASAEVIVIGKNAPSRTQAYGYIYALGNGTGDKFSPALPVWNQFMYDPFKINTDLTTPTGPAPNRLEYKYNKEVGSTTIQNFQPYNNTLGQIFYYESTEVGNASLMEPIVFLTEAYIASGTDPVVENRPKIIDGGATSFIEVTIGNNESAKTDISVQTPIAVYKNDISATSYFKTVRLGDLHNEAIKAGEKATIRIPITEPYEVYHVRLGDDSGKKTEPGDTWVWEEWHFGTNNGINPPADPLLGIGTSSRAYRDCDWRDQAVKVSLVSVNHDAVTVQQYGSVSIDIFENDELPQGLNPSPQDVVRKDDGPIAGSIQFANNKIIYTHDATAPLPDNIDMFSYEIEHTPTPGNTITYTAHVYIYVLEAESGGFAACYGNTLKTKLKENPEGIRFLWNANPNSSDIYPDNYNGGTGSEADSLTINFGPVTTPKAYKVKPLLTFYNNERIDFAPGNLTIGVLGSGSDNAVFRWTGEMNTNWNDPRNWVEVKNNRETPVLFVPTTCVDVIIPSGLKNYPMLTAPAACADITMKDRAMIAGIHHLTYGSARVELTLNAAERDRFIMWSAPLKSMYSGDYHFKDAASPTWGDVYMNMFQQPNPGGSVAAAINTFTATFGNLGVSLPKGKAFNLKVTSTTANTGKSFTFPQTIDKYIDTNGDEYDVTRGTDAGKFIIDKSDSNPLNSASASLPVVNDIAGNNLVQVVNPYMAYLNVNSFLTNNSTLDNVGYAIWDGSTSGFNQIGVIGNKDNRYDITTAPPTLSDPTGFIPPLQSFFVQKYNGATTLLGAVTINAEWATTTPGSPYKLRADAPETNILRIKAVQNKQVSYAVLHYNESTSPAYNSKEDMHKLFYQLEEGVTPLEVYTFAPTREVLAINSSSDFSQNTPLGLRTDKAGSVTLEFSGMATFGHNVYLIDHAQSNKETDLQKNPTYTFTATKKSASDKVIELNDRFSLRAAYTGIGLGNEATGSTADISVFARNGYLYIQTPSPVSSLQVYNLTGALVYSSVAPSDYFRIQTDGQQVYIVKVIMNDQYIMKKAFLK